MEQNIFFQISKEIDEFQKQSVQIVDKFRFNQKKTIDRIYYYYNSQFESGEFDSEGFKKYFFNIVKNPCYVATKAVDFDTKDIIITAAPGHSTEKAWLLDRDLKFWFKKIQFGKLLNRIFYELPIFGSVVLKKVQNRYHFVDLRNLINEQSADSLEKSSYVIEIHYYTPEELREKNWDNIEETIKFWQETKVPYIRIIERYGLVPENWLKPNGDPKKYVYSRFIVYIKETKPSSQRLEVDRVGLVLDKTKLDRKDFPYREIHWEKIPGRWLGQGRVEILFDPQIRVNEEMNLRVKSSFFSSLHLFQTIDETLKQNLLEVKTGQVLQVRSPITRVPTEERNLSSYETEHRLWLQNRDELTMSYDVIRGERLPAGTPLGAAMLAATMTTSYFDQIRENIALEIKELLYKDIVPQFLAENTKEHYLKLIGEDIDKWHRLQKKRRMNEEFFRFLARQNKIPTPVQQDLIRERIEESKEEIIFIPKDFYKDLEYDIDVVITGEAKDIRVRAMNLQMALQAITVDPTLLSDPVKRKILAQILEAGGVKLEDIELSTREPEREVLTKAVRGGGISKPVLPPLPVLERGETRL